MLISLVMLGCCRFFYRGWWRRWGLVQCVQKGWLKWGCQREEVSNWISSWKGGFCHECYCEKKYCVSMRVLNLFQDLLVSWLEVFMGVGTKDKRLVRTDNSSSANMWSERMCIVFVVLGTVCFDGISREFPEWRFSGKSTFIDAGVYMRINGRVGSRVISSMFMWFCVSSWTPNVSSCIKGI